MSLAPNLVALVTRAKTHCRAHLFRVIRRDRVVQHFTDHNTRLTYEGQGYDPVAGFDISAFRGEANLREVNATIQGIINSGRISFDALRGGLYDGARIEVREVDWRFPWQGALTYKRLWVTECSFDGKAWKAELVGLTRLLENALGDLYTRACRWELGEAFGDATKPGCKFDIDSLSYFALSVGVVTSRNVFTVPALPVSLGDEYFGQGKVEFLTGANQGLENRTLKYTAATRTFTFAEPMPFDIQSGDLINAYVGCDLRASTCKGRFQNFRNFGGFPFLEGQDRLTRSVK